MGEGTGVPPKRFPLCTAVIGLAGLSLLTGALLAVAVRVAGRAVPDASGSIDQCRVTAGCVYQAPPPDPFLVPTEVVVLQPSLVMASAEPAERPSDDAFVAVPERPPTVS